MAIHWRDFCSALIVAIVSIGYIAIAQTYPRDTGTVPTIAGIAAVILSIIDAISQTETTVGRWLRRVLGSEMAPEAASAEKQPENVRPMTIVYSVLWPLGYLVAIILAGFMLVTPPYIFFYMYFYGRRSILLSATAAAIVTLVIWFAFHILFEYPLFPGLLFGGSW
jgi:hypothetical protein